MSSNNIAPAAIQIKDANGNTVTNVFEWSGTTQKITSGGVSAQSTVFADTAVVRIVSTAAAHYAIGTNPTATSSSVYLPANSGEQIKVFAGNKIAVLAASGDFYITEGK